MATKQEPDPQRMYICRATCGLPNGATIFVGERRNGSDPLVRDFFDWWADELETTPEQLRSEEAEKFQRLMRADPDRASRPAQPQRTVMVCVKPGLPNPATGFEVQLGERHLDVSELVRKNPQFFRPLEEVFPEAAA